MKNLSIVIAAVIGFTLTACDTQPAGGGYALQGAQVQAQQDAYERQMKTAEEQSRQGEELLKRQIALQDVAERETKRAEEQAKRMEALLQKWEDQAKRYDAILTRWEQQPSPEASNEQQ